MHDHAAGGHADHYAHAEGQDHVHDREGHGNSHLPTGFDKAFAIGTDLNLGFFIIEAGYGIAAGSMALLADAGHNLRDVLGLPWCSPLSKNCLDSAL